MDKIRPAMGLLLIGTTILILVSCRVQKNPVVSPQSNSLVVRGPLWGAMWQQKAAEYKALCYQAYNLAKLRLDAILLQPHTRPLAIVTDIDETVLDNSPYEIHRALMDSLYSDESWIAWTAKVECDTIPGALTFMKYAYSKGVKIFYITNRLEVERNPTLKDLQRWNFPDASHDHLFLKQSTSGKEERRSVIAKDHEIILLFGDNLSDFSAVFDKQPFPERDRRVAGNAHMFGDRFIVLPNVAYGNWEDALYNFNYNLTPAQKDSIIIGQLKTY